jgi:glutamine amidotransferase
MNRNVVVVDYGLGNMHSVANALRFVGATVSLAADGRDLKNVDRVVLPGVGAYGDGMVGLRARGHFEELLDHASRGRPLLGICLGAQLLLEKSEEFGTTTGLGLIEGEVKSIPREGVKVPHIGWQRLQKPAGDTWDNSVLEHLTEGTWSYFVHSFHAVPRDPRARLAVVRHGDHCITAAVKKDNVTGLQFHPEKSGPAGLSILEKFLAKQ